MIIFPYPKLYTAGIYSPFIFTNNLRYRVIGRMTEYKKYVPLSPALEILYTYVIHSYNYKYFYVTSFIVEPNV